MKPILVFVDCEDINWIDGRMREFGAVEFVSRQTFHGKNDSRETFEAFRDWLASFNARPILVSDNPAYDAGGMNMLFWRHLGHNPFGHSARRLGDFYAGLVGDFYRSTEWKKLRKTKHDHNPVNDAMGNVEAFEAMLAGNLQAKGIPTDAEYRASLEAAMRRSGQVGTLRESEADTRHSQSQSMLTIDPEMVAEIEARPPVAGHTSKGCYGDPHCGCVCGAEANG